MMNSLLLSFVFLAIILTLILTNTSNVFGQTFENKNENNTIFYGCQEQIGAYHCNRLHNNLESYKITSHSTSLYNASDTPMFVGGKEGSALQMYANNLNSILFSNTSTLSPKQFSIAFWVRGVSLPNNPNSPGLGNIISQFNEDNTGGWAFVSTIPYGQNLSQQSIRFSVYSNAGVAFSSSDVPIYHNNSFTHIVGTFDGSLIKIYKDGGLVGQTEFNGAYNNGSNIPLTLGVAAPYPMSYYWTGNIDDLRYYNRAISSDEVKNIYNISQSIENSRSLNEGLIGQWKFNDNLDDSSGNDHNGSERTLISSMAFAPDGRLFFTEKDTGRIKIMENGTVDSNPFATIYNFRSSWEQGLLGLAIDSKFKDNHFIYVYYNYNDTGGRNIYARIVRFTDVDNRGTNETVILDKIPASNAYHTGGALAFNKNDDKLYVTVGDATRNVNCGNLPVSFGVACPAQDPSSLLGKVLRINRDGSIPEDNPYPGSPVYNIGHINMYGIAFDKSGFGLVSENGDELYDEINTNEKGANYGAPTLQPLDTDPGLSSNSTKPLRTYYFPVCLTQMIYYDGDKMPNLKDKFLVGNLDSSNSIYALEVDKTKKQIVGENAIFLDNFPNNEVVALAQSPTGEIYYGSYGINRLDSVDNNNNESNEQIMFPIIVSYSSPLDVNSLTFIPSKKEIIMDIDNKTRIHNGQDERDRDTATIKNTDSNISNTTNSYLRLKIPKALLQEVKSVNATPTTSTTSSTYTFTTNTSDTHYTNEIPFLESKKLPFSNQNTSNSKYTTLNIPLCTIFQSCVLS